MRAAEAARYLGMSISGVRKAAVEGRLKHTVSAAGQRIYEKEDLDAYLGRKSPRVEHRDRVEALYVRVSGSTGQETSIAAQEAILRETSSGDIHRVYRDTASGLNEKRKGLTKLLDDASEKKFTVVRVVWKDRLSRFGVSYLERLLNAYGVQLEILQEKPDKSLIEELMDDFMSILASFSGRFYQLRSTENKRKLLARAEERLCD